MTAKAMIEKLAKKVVTWQVQKNYLLIKDEKLYIYAYELLIGQAVNILIACFLAIAFHAYTTVLIFLL
ncbi:accessory gene regulator B family protein, partial [Anaerocolumna sp.]|uniref:accessory gene regulator B family protein n=1 Tax=Anaerocolumna sp. TaxID=2041569 RepID=UPI0028A962D6